MYYSVPNSYIRHKVDVRITIHTIEVFHKNNRICSHKKLTGIRGQYSTYEEHMPESHKRYLNWDSNKIIEKAENIGPSALITVKSILNSYKVEQQSYRSCMGLLKLAEKYSEKRLESACEKALSYTPHPSLKSVEEAFWHLLWINLKKTIKTMPTTHPNTLSHVAQTIMEAS